VDVSGIRLDRANGAALYRQVCEALVGAIARGELPAGERLPSERELSERLAISRTTAVSAYRELRARGLVRGQVGRGTYVCALPEPDGPPFAWRGQGALAARRTPAPGLRGLVGTAAAPGPISFAAGVSALDRFPARAFREATERALGAGAPAALGLGPTEGHPRLRRTIARRSGGRPTETLGVAGAQQGLDLVARCLLDPGDTVVLERPGYLGAIEAFRAADAHLVGWDVRRDDLDELDDLLARHRPKLLYVNPTFQNPTGRTLPLRARRELLEVAARHRLPIVEDDPYRDLGFAGTPPPTLRALDARGLVIHIGTFAKTLAGGLRLGWLDAAAPIVDQLALVKGRADVSGPTLTQLVVADLLTTGAYETHLGALRAERARRHAALLAALWRHLPPGTLACRPVGGGLYLWGSLGDGVSAHELLTAATAAGVVFAPGTLFYPDAAGGHELRLCFSGVPPDAIEAGVRRLGRALARIGDDKTDRSETEAGRPLDAVGAPLVAKGPVDAGNP
jgi:DNA-binding transcriptional MocR family regulator